MNNKELKPYANTEYTNSKSKIKTLTSDNNGITLIALVITIIVMLILVAVTVTVAINGGLFSTAKQATTDTQYHADREMLLSAVIGAINKDAEVDFEKLDANLPNGFTGTQGEYTSEAGNTFYVDKNGNITDEKVEETEMPATVAELKAGKYVNYIDNEGNTIKSIVLYDEAYNKEHGTDYGIQIITADVVKNIEFESSCNFDRECEWLPELREEAQNLLNTKLSLFARCVGSDPSNSTLSSEHVFEVEDYTDEWESPYQNLRINEFAITDWSQLTSFDFNATACSNEYWLYQQYRYEPHPDGDMGGLLYVDTNGELCTSVLASYDGYGALCNYYLRPCFKLIPEIKITSGNGTIDNPYQLEIPE